MKVFKTKVCSRKDWLQHKEQLQASGMKICKVSFTKTDVTISYTPPTLEERLENLEDKALTIPERFNSVVEFAEEYNNKSLHEKSLLIEELWSSQRKLKFKRTQEMINPTPIHKEDEANEKEVS